MSLILVLGVSPNPDRYSNKAVRKLRKHGYEVAAVGFRTGDVEGIPIQTGFPVIQDVDTISLYMGTDRQAEYLDYMISLQPSRIIFNPGAENPDFYPRCKENRIEVVEDCMFIMINTDNF